MLTPPWKLAAAAVLMTAQVSAKCAGDPPRAAAARTPASEAAAPPRPTVPRADPARFVQDFYDWYAPLAARQQDGDALYSVLRERPSALSPQLRRALQADAAAAAVAQGEIVGLDFDPFLASQDPCERYVVGRSTKTDSGEGVDVHSVCSGQRSTTPDLTVDLAPAGGAWVITNVRYPGGRGDLLATLRDLANQRR
jgi:hypothetical protein